jgi:hypothetical protein
MRNLVMCLAFLWMTSVWVNVAESQERQKLLSTEEWVALNNRDEKASVYYLRGIVDTLGAIGNFTCRRPVVFGQSAARIRVDYQDHPETVQTWFIFALMADLTRNYTCRFTDTDRPTYTNQKLKEWETTK